MNNTPQDIGIGNSTIEPLSGAHRFSAEAMATTFEIFIVHNDAAYAQQAALAAFRELERLERLLSRYVEGSDIWQINNLPCNQTLVLNLETFECLQLCSDIYASTNGAFDITAGHLKDYWLAENKTGAESSSIAPRGDFNLIKLNPAEYTVQLAGPVQIDLGGIGKGYAVDKMAELLSECSIDTALISSGGSSVLAVSTPPKLKGWPLTLSNPANNKLISAQFFLRDSALSCSGLQKGPHIIDPRTAQPVKNKLTAWSFASDAASADALSTAFMVMTAEEIEQYCMRYPNVSAMVITTEGDKSGCGKILRYGSWPQDSFPEQ